MVARGRTPQPGRRRVKRDSDRSGLVQSLTRGLSMLEILAGNEDGLRLVDLAERVNLPPSTTHRLLTTLEQKRFVQLDRQTGQWHIGVQCFAVGSVFLHRRDLVVQAHPMMRRLRDEAGETVNLGVAADGDLVFLAQVESRELMRAISRPGGRTSMHCSGMGKALLAAMPEAEARHILAEKGLRRWTEKTLVDEALVLAEIARGRGRGWSIDDEEHAIGLRCVAAVIYDEYSQPLAAISLSGPKVRIPDDRIPALARLVTRTADDITTALGGRRPQPREE